MGGAFAWCLPIIALLALVCFLVTLIPQDLSEVHVPPVLWGAIAASAWTMLQVVPLGSALSAWLSPERTSARRQLTAALGELPTSATAITFDPGATQLELLKGCALLCAFCACYLTARRGHTALLLTAVSASGTLMALVALCHRALDARAVFGLYAWQLAAPRLPAPILNDNCLAGFMVLTAPVALGIALSTSDARVRLLQYVSALVLAGTGLLTGSRAGIGAMVFALCAMVFAARLRMRAHRDRWLQTGLVGIIGSAAVAIGIVVGAEPVLNAFDSEDFSKLGVIGDAFRLALDHPWLGVGRGGFSAAMTPLMPDGRRFVHAENFVATWLSEWGIPVGLVVVAIVSKGVFRLLTTGSTLRLAAGVGLFALAAQNLFDLGLELLGIASVAAAVLAAGLGNADQMTPPGPSLTPARLDVVSWAIVLASALTLLWVTPNALANGDQAFERRMAHFQAKGRRAEFRDELGRALAAHPFEPGLYFAAGRECVDYRDPMAFRWLNLAMLRAPMWSAPHLQATRLLVALGRPHQAALEAREAAALSPVSGARAACAVAKTYPHIEHVFRASEGVRNEQERQIFFDEVARCVDDAVSRSIDHHLIGRGVAIANPVLRERKRLVAEGNQPAATALLAVAAATRPTTPEIMLEYARGLLIAGQTAQAARTLAAARTAGANPLGVAQAAAEIATARGDTAAMRTEIEAIRALGAGYGQKLAEAALLRARLETKLGNSQEARLAIEDAVALDPSVRTLRAALKFARSGGNLTGVSHIRASLCRMAPDISECRSWAL